MLSMQDLEQKLSDYVDMFNAHDDELYPQAFPNAQAFEFLKEQIPLFECPDPILEKVYYFRWWVFRKHLKETPEGFVITEFLPDVYWAGPYNTINCSACFHLREGRWLADPQNRIKNYIQFWLDGKGDSLSYSSWFAEAVESYCMIRGDYGFAEQCLERLVDLYHRWEDKALTPCGLFWSDDDRDAMEFSVSGPGLRPTLNSYMYGDACSIARIARASGRTALAEEFETKAETLRGHIENLLWDQDFYKTIPCKKEEADFVSRPSVRPDHSVRELIGYIPWWFDIPADDHAAAFSKLLQEEGFYAPYGLTTTERSHPRFMFKHVHECLWNGPSWPFATSQTLVAAAKLLHNGNLTFFTKADYYNLLSQYVRAHQIVDEDGVKKPWIDENLDPFTGKWLARSILKDWGWPECKGGYERGKDYNHSLFCDLVLSGLLGIENNGNEPEAHPLIPDSWEYFRVSHLPCNGKKWTVLYDRDGFHYNKGAGIKVIAENECCKSSD